MQKEEKPTKNEEKKEEEISPALAKVLENEQKEQLKKAEDDLVDNIKELEKAALIKKENELIDGDKVAPKKYVKKRAAKKAPKKG